MCRFIGVKEDDYEDESEEAKRDANKKYLIFYIRYKNLSFTYNCILTYLR